MLKPGALAPDFNALCHDGREFQFSEWRAGRPAVLYFYPKNFTAG